HLLAPAAGPQQLAPASAAADLQFGFNDESHWHPAPGLAMISRNGGLPMNHCLLPSGVAALAAAFVFLSLAQSPGAAQTQSPATKVPISGKAWTQPRTPDGQPDLQGYWTNNTITPLERPKGLGAKEFYTEEESTARIKQEGVRLKENEEEGHPTEPGTAADVHYDF